VFKYHIFVFQKGFGQCVFSIQNLSFRKYKFCFWQNFFDTKIVKFVWNLC